MLKSEKTEIIKKYARHDCSVTLDVNLNEVVEKASSLADHLQQAAAGVMILLVGTEVLGIRK